MVTHGKTKNKLVPTVMIAISIEINIVMLNMLNRPPNELPLIAQID